MRCPDCQHEDTRVVDSRTPDPSVVRRRRECQACGARFTTFERIDQPILWVVKKDGTKEPFDREKVLRGLVLACQKRPVGADRIQHAVLEVERELHRLGREVDTSAVGEAVLGVLREVDEVAYVRFASVYRAFDSADEFARILGPLRESS